MTDRYAAQGPEAEFEPGSRGRVLRNLLGIKRRGDIVLAESQALTLAQREAVEMFQHDHRFSAADVRQLHRFWLGPIYAWAGEYRTVNLGKSGFQFASAWLISGLMERFEREALARYTPCRPASDEKIAKALAVVHGELVLIHPFREGNGRVARLLALVMGFQAGLPPMNFAPLDRRGKRGYITAIHAAMDNNYDPLAGIFAGVIERTRTSASSSSR